MEKRRFPTSVQLGAIAAVMLFAVLWWAGWLV